MSPHAAPLFVHHQVLLPTVCSELDLSLPEWEGDSQVLWPAESRLVPQLRGNDGAHGGWQGTAAACFTVAVSALLWKPETCCHLVTSSVHFVFAAAIFWHAFEFTWSSCVPSWVLLVCERLRATGWHFSIFPSWQELWMRAASVHRTWLRKTVLWLAGWLAGGKLQHDCVPRPCLYLHVVYDQTEEKRDWRKEK